MEVYEPTAAGGGTSGTGSVTISGSDRSYTFDPCPPHGSCPQTIWDGGTIAVTVNGVQAGSTGYGSNTTSSLASALASSINGNSSSPVTASASGSTVYLTAKTTGSSTNYSLSASSYTQNTQYFSGTSFPVSTSGSTLTGGQNAVYSTVYDSGTCTITVNSHGNSTTWSGSGTSGSSIASALVSGINGDSAAFVTASASGSVVNLTAKGIGSGTDYSLASSCSYDTSHFSSPSFTPSNSGSTLTGGADNSSLDVTYNFADPVSGHNAGVVYGITNNLDSTRSQTFSYDQLNRITSALTTSTYSTSPAHCWGENYTLDPWANLNSIAATTTPGYTGCSQESGFSTTADGNNHLPVFGYDPSGNTLSDGFVTNYQWDAESQLNSAAGVTYTYDGDGRRVAKVGSKLYWYGSGGDILAETNTSGAVTAEYIFFGGKRIAMLPASGNPTYYVEDMLGTSRVLTTNAGVVCYDADFYPYGGERSYTNTCPQTYKFEGKERDAETGNDDFGDRYYSNRFGRWLSADWSAVPVPVPYANLANPQTLNLYSMVSDDPESFADLDGHSCEHGPPGAGSGPCEQQDELAEGEAAYTQRVQETTDQANAAKNKAQNQSDEAAKQQGSAVSGLFEKDPGPPPAPQAPKPPVGNPSLDGAGTAAVTAINPTSIQQGVEYAGRGYQNPDGSYSYTAPNRGTVDRSSHGSIESLPPRTRNAFLYHTHGSATPGYDNEHFSPQDKRNARTEHVPSYLATPGGKVLRFDPSTGRVTQLN